MSLLPLGRLFGLALVLLSATTLSAQLTTYTYQGKPFNTLISDANGVVQQQPLTTTDAISGQVTFFSPLPPNQSDSVNLAGNIASYSFTDGSGAVFGSPLGVEVFGGSLAPVTTWTPANSTLAFFARTDSQGTINTWLVALSSCCVAPLPLGPPVVSFQLSACGGGAPMACNPGDRGSAQPANPLNELLELNFDQGSWGGMSTAPPLQITTPSLPNPLPGQPYSATITAAGGTGIGYVWSIASGAPPPGFELRTEGSCGPACTTVTLSGPASPAPPLGAYNFTVQVVDSANHMDTRAFAFCLVNVQLIFTGEDASLDGLPTQMLAKLTAPNNGPLLDFASSCGFVGFDFVQAVIEDESGAQVFAELDPNNALTPTYPDPPLGGYSFQFKPPFSGTPDDYTRKNQPNFQTASPFYYSPNDVVLDSNNISKGCAAASPPTDPYLCTLRISDAFTLNFFDPPSDEDCSPPAPCLGFRTQLVGVVCAGPQPCSLSSPTGLLPSSPLFQWSWRSNFDGLFGGIFMESRGSVFPPDPHSGKGGATITDINGVPQTSPSLTCSATPTTLWPPDGMPVLVTVSGTVTPGTQAIPDGGGAFNVRDEYQQVQPIGNFTPGAGGSYSYSVPLTASRNGDDLDGRTYTIVTVVRDSIGNAGSCSSVITVPHDQGN